MINIKRSYKALTVLAVFLAIFIASAVAFSASHDPWVKYRTIKTDHFNIHYSEALESVAERLANIAEDAHAKLSPKMRWKPWGRTEVVFTDSSDSPSDMATILPFNWLFIRATAPGPNTSISTFDDWLKIVFTHEYSHILQLDNYGGIWYVPKVLLGKTIAPNGVTPNWHKEGMAAYEETINSSAGRGRSSYTEMVLRTGVLQNKFQKIDQADGLGWKWPDGNTPYLYGVKFMQYLADTYGEEKLYEFIHRTGRSPLLFAVNHVARKTFSEMEFEDKKVGLHYTKEKKKGVPQSKTFYDIWRDWEAKITEKYTAEAEKIKSEGVTDLTTVTAAKKEGILQSLAISPDGKKIAYTDVNPFGAIKVKMVDLDDPQNIEVVKKVNAQQLSFSKDGKSLYYSRVVKFKKYYFYHELYKYDLETKKETKLTVGKRVADPDISSDGASIVGVNQHEGTEHLVVYNVEDKSVNEIPTGTPDYTQFANPRFSPDGKMIAVAVSKPEHIWDIYIYSKDGKLLTEVTDTPALDRDPSWDPSGKYLYYSSDETGIANIYRYNVATKKKEKVTNVLTGVFEPKVAPDGKSLVLQYYNGNGFDIRKMELEKKSFVDESKIDKSWLRQNYGDFKTAQAATALPPIQPFESKKYSPFQKSLFLPRFVMPGFAYLGDAFFFSGYTGGSDPLRWHNWLGGVTFRTDDNYLGFFFNYWYSRFRPIIEVGVARYVVDFGNFTFLYPPPASNRTFHLYESRLRGHIRVTYPEGRHAFGAQYFYEDRSPDTKGMTSTEKSYFNFGKYAGVMGFYTYNDAKQYQASISREGGRKIGLGVTTTSYYLGSAKKNEQTIFAGDWREYIKTFGRQVLALRAMGGITWGDQFRQGTFTMGGDLGEGLMASGGNLYYFPLRGLPVATLARTRALLFSGEYRFPIVSAQRGLGTLPVFLDELHFGLFADYGNAWNANQSTGKYFFDNFFLGTGGELRGNFYLGHGLPITGRLGYGIIVVNRDRLGSLRSYIIDQPVKYGVLILQLGTSF